MVQTYYCSIKYWKKQTGQQIILLVILRKVIHNKAINEWRDSQWIEKMKT